jgi:hypothetical protein
VFSRRFAGWLIPAVTLFALLTGCTSASTDSPIDLSSEQPSLLFFYTDP